HGIADGTRKRVKSTGDLLLPMPVLSLSAYIHSLNEVWILAACCVLLLGVGYLLAVLSFFFIERPIVSP
ncbi:MAG: hypothetical protein LBK62_10665, partial [Treponema sp.]|nr:hypothetical protein [Treponema sp.]